MKPLVLCLHSYGSSGRQFRSLAQRLEPRFRVAAPDLHGGDPVPEAPDHLVGHSYGAAMALRLAAKRPVRSLVLYEPIFWGTLSQVFPEDPATREIEALRDETVALAEAGDLERTAERFYDYWGGAGSWAAIPVEARKKLLAPMRTTRANWEQTFADRWTIDALRALDAPCLLLTGSRTKAPARQAVRFLAAILPRATFQEIPGAGHMGPLTHAAEVDAAIESFLHSERTLQWAHS